MSLNNRSGKAASVLLIAVLAAFALSPLFFAPAKEAVAREAVITVGGEVVRRVPLDESGGEESFVVVTPCGKNHVHVRNGRICVEEAECPEKICVRRGEISQVGESIACLPHKLLIVIREKR